MQDSLPFLTGGSEERTVELPTARETVPAGIERIVVQISGPQPKIDTTAAREVQLFGSYRSRFHIDEETPLLRQDDVASIHTTGNTMYIGIKQLPQRMGLNKSYTYETLTLALPNDVKVELRGPNNQPIDS